MFVKNGPIFVPNFTIVQAFPWQEFYFYRWRSTANVVHRLLINLQFSPNLAKPALCNWTTPHKAGCVNYIFGLVYLTLNKADTKGMPKNLDRRPY